MSNKPYSGILPLSFIKSDLQSGLVVFLIALPLCLGIALASGAPLFSGLIAGVVGGVVVSIFSGSQLSVSGPAAGLTVIVLNAITTLGSYPAFLFALVLAGILQLTMGYLKAGVVANYFPSSVIKGMLAAIGIILIIKQVPHAVGYDLDFDTDYGLIQLDPDHPLAGIANVFNKTNMGAVVISAISMFILIIGETKGFKKLRIPAPLLVVIVGVLVNIMFDATNSLLSLRSEHLVQIPVSSGVNEFITFFTLPDFSQFTNKNVYIVAFTLAIVASLESLLSLEAIDRLDPQKRVSPTNQELKAQGIGNIVSGMIGGLPLTAVIVRGSANVHSGAKTKTSAFIHGVFLFLAVVFAPQLINKIPLACLAAILLMVGYKLANISLFKSLYKAGWDQFIPFAITIPAIVFTDLLKGIAIGFAAAVFFILKKNMMISYYFHKEETYDEKAVIKISLAEEVSFLNKANIVQTLKDLPDDSKVIINGSRSHYIDYDVIEAINDFKANAHYKNIDVELIGIKEIYSVSTH